MRINQRTRLQFRLQNTSFIVLLLTAAGLLAWLSTRYSIEADWTSNQRHTLSQTTLMLLRQFQEPMNITVYASARQGGVRKSSQEIIARYTRHKSDIAVRFVDPDSAPGEVRERGITRNGEWIVEYQGRTEHLLELSEESIAQVLHKLLRAEEHIIVFLSGHGERKPYGEANYDFGDLGRYLSGRGLQIQSFNFEQAAQIPDNTSVLVIAGPRTPLLPGEISGILAYLEKGGNLLWLLDPGPMQGLEALAEKLGLSVQPGVLVDLVSKRLFGGEHQTSLLVSEYNQHPINEKLMNRGLFPEAVGLHVDAPEDWKAETLFSTHEQVWAESDITQEPLEFQDSDKAGPFPLGIALSRVVDTARDDAEKKTKEQRVVIVGDGDFLSNSYLGNGANLDLGFGFLNWLTHQDNLISIPARVPSDRTLDLPQSSGAVIAFVFLFFIPLALLGGGVLIWWKRRGA